MTPRRTSAVASQSRTDATRTVATREHFPVVAIGASAGGLDAFKEFLSALDTETGMSFILLQHLAPEHKSILAELLANATTMPVVQAVDGMVAEPDHVYVIPPSVDMSIRHGQLRMLARSAGSPGPHMSIDFFFRSLAREAGHLAIAVVLSGTASDGAEGLRAIRSEGGITFAQDPSGAPHPGMPRAAIAAGAVDFILSAKDIAEKISSMAKHPYLNSGDVAIDRRLAEDPLRALFSLLRESTGIDFTQYKRASILRRIQRRMALGRIEVLGDYVELLQNRPSELGALFDDISINVTSFFRDAPVFEYLKETVFPRIMQERPESEPIRIWVPGCATGQEAYSIAIALLEFLENEPAPPRVQIFATDIQEKALEVGRRGVYPASSVETEVSADRIHRYFRRADGGYQVSLSIREMCIFARHDVTSDPPFRHLDIVSCRNLLIYLASPLQHQVLLMFQWALDIPGFLVLGQSESVGQKSRLFEEIDRENKVFMRAESASRLPSSFARGAGAPESMRRISWLTQGHDAEAPDSAGASEIKRLTVELDETRHKLQGFNDQRDMVNEELQAANEELETSAEELQSTNVELVTLNQELIDRGVELDRLSWDLNNVLSSALIPMVLLGLDLRIRRVTPQAEPALNVRPLDVGRSIGDVDISLVISDLEELLSETIETESSREIQVQDGRGHWYMLRLRPYLARNRRIDGAIMTLHDIDALKQSEQLMQERSDYFSSIVQTVLQPLIVLDDDWRVVSANKAFFRQFGGDEADTVGERFSKLADGEWDNRELRQALVQIADNETLRDDIQIEQTTKEGELRNLLVSARRFRGTEGSHLILIAIDNMTERETIRLQRADEKRLGDALNDLSALISSTLNLDKALPAIIEEAVKVLNCGSGAVLFCDDGRWLIHSPFGFPPQLEGTELTEIEACPVLVAASVQKHVIICGDECPESGGGDCPSMLDRLGAASLLIVPFWIRGVTTGALIFDIGNHPASFSEAGLDFARKLAVSVSLAAESARLHKEQLMVSNTLQDAVLRMPESIAGVDYACLYESSDDSSRVGGDFYDIFELEGGQVAFVIGDVSGHGIAAATFTSLLRGMIRAFMGDGSSPAETTKKTNANMVKGDFGSMFVTLFCAIMDSATGKVRYCNAGHPAPLILRESGLVEAPPEHSMIVGALDDPVYEDFEFTMEHGDTLLVHTDGVIEARSGVELFGDERLHLLVESLHGVNIAEMPRSVLSHLKEYATEGLSDDVAILALRRRGD